jgi:hypothetical protein
MFGTSVIAPIATSLTTLELEESNAKILICLGVPGFAVGLGISSPTRAVQTLLSPRQVSMVMAIVGFGGPMGSAISISASAAFPKSGLLGISEV